MSPDAQHKLIDKIVIIAVILMALLAIFHSTPRRVDDGYTIDDINQPLGTVPERREQPIMGAILS